MYRRVRSMDDYQSRMIENGYDYTGKADVQQDVDKLVEYFKLVVANDFEGLHADNPINVFFGGGRSRGTYLRPREVVARRTRQLPGGWRHWIAVHLEKLRWHFRGA